MDAKSLLESLVISLNPANLQKPRNQTIPQTHLMKNSSSQLKLSPHVKRLIVELMQNQCILYQVTIDLEDMLHEWNISQIDAANSWKLIAEFCGIPPENLGDTQHAMAHGVCEHGHAASCNDWILDRMSRVKNFDEAEELVDDMLEEGRGWRMEGVCPKCFSLVGGRYVFRPD